MAVHKTKSPAAVRKDIIAFLDKTSGRKDPRPGKHSCGIRHRNALVLATSYRDTPRATALEFFNEGLTIYIFGEPGGKIANLKRNPKVSAYIYEQPLDHAKLQKSLQIFGTATLISVRNNPRLFRAKARKWNLFGAAEKIMAPMAKAKNLSRQEAAAMIQKGLGSLNLIKIVPHHIILKEYRPDFSLRKYEWKK